jgi:hypothetical protein
VVATSERPRTAQDVTKRVEVRGAVARLWSTKSGEIVISGPAGSAKTRGILEWIHWRCSNERIRVLMLRKTQQSLKSSALVTYQEQVLHEFDGKRSILDGVRYFGGNDITPPQFIYEATGSIIVVGGIDQPSKVKSTEWDVIFPNEATELTLNDWEVVTGRTDRPTLSDRPASIVVGDCNPDAPTHWIKQREAAGSLTIWYSTHKDNPAMWDAKAQRWTESGERYKARLDKLTGVRYQRLALGKWVAAEGQVFDAWDRSIHVVTRASLAAYGLAVPKRNIGAADWGWTNPGVLTVGAVGGDDQVGIVREVYRTRMGPEWWLARAQELTREYDIDTWVCDPSEPQCIDAWRKAGLNARAAVNDILPGVTVLQDLMKPDQSGRVRWVICDDANIDPDPLLLDDDTNPPLGGIQEVDIYVWAKTATGKREKPVDAHNHALDTWRYLAMEATGGGGTFAPVDDDIAGFFRRAGVAVQ